LVGLGDRLNLWPWCQRMAGGQAEKRSCSEGSADL